MKLTPEQQKYVDEQIAKQLKLQQKEINAMVAKRVAEELAARPTAAAPHAAGGGPGNTPAERRKSLKQLIGLSAKASYLQAAAAGGHVNQALADAAAKAATDVGSRFAAKADGPNGAIFSAGGSLMSEEWATDVIGVLRDVMVLQAAGVRIEAVHSSKKNLGKLNSGATAEFVEPGQQPTASTLNTGMVILAPKKCMGLIEPTKDMLRDPSFLGSEATFTDDLLAAIGLKVDLECLVGDGTGPRPNGVLRQIVAGNKFSATVAFTNANISKIIEYLDKAERLVRESKHTFQGAKPAWVMTSKVLMALKSLRDNSGWVFRQQLDQGMLNGYPVHVTDSISGKGKGGKDFIVFGLWDTATFGMAFGGGEAPESGIIVEMSEPKFSQDLATFKGITYVDVKLRYDNTFAVIEEIAFT
jgi:HK97 family phage major capsid protein